MLLLLNHAILYFLHMKHCVICRTEIPTYQHKFCSEKCQKESWRKNCASCGKTFLPSEQRVICCSRECASKWKWTQPETRRKMVENQDLVKRGRNISAGIRKNPKE